MNFTWTFTGGLRVVVWGTKQSGAIDLDKELVSFDENGPIFLNVPSQYSGRVNGSWDGRTPGKLLFTLTSIKEEDDKQIFICKLSPKVLVAPVVYDTVQLIVRDPPKAKIVIPDKSSVQTARVGDSISFTCNVSGIPVPTITWMKQNDSGLSEVAADNVKVIASSGSSQLIVEDISVDDEGYYICNASSYEFHLDKAFLGVISLYENHDSCPSTNQIVTRGVSSTICCPVRGFPPPQVTWKYPNGTVSETGNTILPITMKTLEDFGNYTCIATGLKETVPDPIIVTINVQEEGQKTLIRADDVTQLTKDDLFKWNEVKGAREYICRICGPHINCISLIGDKPSLEIPYTTLKFKSPQTKPDPVQVMIEVLAVGENDVLGRGGPFNLTISPATTPGLSLTLAIFVFLSILNL